MIRFSRMIMQWALMPPIAFNFHFHSRPLRSLQFHRDRLAPEPARFDPKRKIDGRQARMIAASNAFTHDTKENL
jgi:hypothetical protein